jgi:hypothetical protein
MELASLTSFDRLIVTGHAALGTQLLIELAGGYMPAAGDSFDLIDWGSVSGTFNVLQYPVLPGDLEWDFSQASVTGVVRVVSTALDGDYNEDGRVDAADYVVWRKGLGMVYLPDDYGVWREHYGNSNVGSGSGASLPAPEPATFCLALAAALACVGGRRGRT